jgi:hypothetical protein
MAEHIRERYGIATRSGGSIQATEAAQHTVQVRVYDEGAAKTVMLTSAEARRFASMLLVLAARAEGDVE